MNKVVNEGYIAVKQAARRSGYTRTHIHWLAREGHIGSAKVTDNFRLVSWPDIEQYMKEHHRAAPTGGGDERPDA